MWIMDTLSSSANTLVILNPAANRGKMSQYRALVHRHLEHELAEYRETTKRGEAQELSQQAAEQGRSIVVVGGDGTVNEAVNGILASGRSVPLGIVAAGSGNDLAWNTLILPRDPEASILRALKGQPTNIDIGVANGRYFASFFSVGLDADMVVASEWMKKIPFMAGSRLYTSAALKQLLFGYHRCPWLKLCVDDGQQLDQQHFEHYTLMVVSIGPTYGGGFRINPSADHKDGLFDICMVNYIPRLRALRLLPVAKRGQHVGLPEITFYRAKSLQVVSQHVVNTMVDGEIMSAMTCDARILPGALWVRS
jgi:diacylglycerol kinase (ATP)